MSAIGSLLGAGEPPEQDYITLGGSKSPGRATVRGAALIRDFAKQKGYGYSGATLIFTGEDLSEFDVTIDLWTDEHWQEWDTFSAVLRKPPIGDTSVALDIGHPTLNKSPIDIHAVVVKNVSQFECDEYGLWSCTITFSAYRKPQKALGKPNASIPSIVNKPPVARTAADIEEAKLLAEFQALAKGG